MASLLAGCAVGGALVVAGGGGVSVPPAGVVALGFLLALGGDSLLFGARVLKPISGRAGTFEVVDETLSRERAGGVVLRDATGFLGQRVVRADAD